MILRSSLICFLSNTFFQLKGPGLLSFSLHRSLWPSFSLIFVSFSVAVHFWNEESCTMQSMLTASTMSLAVPFPATFPIWPLLSTELSFSKTILLQDFSQTASSEFFHSVWNRSTFPHVHYFLLIYINLHLPFYYPSPCTTSKITGKFQPLFWIV